MKFKIYNKTTKKTSGPFSMSDIKAYDGELKTIWFGNKDGTEEIGNDLGYGEKHNHTKEIQDNLIFLLFTGICDSKGLELYNHDPVEFIEDKLYMIPDNGFIVSSGDGRWKIVTRKKDVMLADMFEVIYKDI